MDAHKQAYLQRYDILQGRMKIENFNSEDREPTIWELLSKTWNDVECLPLMEALPDLHSDFAEGEKICDELVSNFYPETPEKLKEKLNSMTLQLNCVIMN